MGHISIWLLAGLTFFLSLWIVVPGPTLFWLPLAVGAPEISPLLGLISVLLLVIVLWNRFHTLLMALLLATLTLSSLPLLQQPRAVAQAEQSMAIAFAAPSRAASYAPFNWLNFFKGIPTGQFRLQTNIPFANPDGTALALDLYQPPLPKRRYPTVVTIYGGGWRDGSPAASAAMGRFLAARGYVVVAIDYRHAPAYRFPAQLEDVQAALAFVSDRADEYQINRDAIALLGWSAGAHLAMLAGFQPNSSTDISSTDISTASPPTPKIRSIINYYGPIDLAAGYREPPQPDPIDVKQLLAAFIGGTPSELPAAYAQASPITYVHSATADSLPPTLLIYGGRDHIVEPRFGKQLYDALINSNNTAVWINIPWAEHAFDKVFSGVSNQMALHFIERFLEQTLRQ